MTEPLVSVSMITYRHARYIGQAIEGVVQQKTSFPFELVIGEDCSPDGTREIVFEYAKKYPNIVRVIASDKNVGMKINGLRTLRACQGKYVAFCEGDDYWHNPEKLQKQADYLESHSDCGLVYSSYDVYHVTSGKRIVDFIKYRKWDMPDAPTIIDLLESKGGRSRGITTCTVMARRKLLTDLIDADPYIHQNDKFPMGDTQLWAEMSTKSRLHFLPESLATHNITDESATRSVDIQKILRFRISGAELQLYLCEKYGLPSQVKLKYQRYLFHCLLWLAFYTKDGDLADEVRRKMGKLSLKEWIRYWGAKRIAIHHGYRAALVMLSVFREKHSQWT
jgi:glycosyltransferase involved in cell wall biosynthesis